MPLKPSEIEYEIGQRVVLRRFGRLKPKTVYTITDVKPWRTTKGTRIYGVVREANGFPSSVSAADIMLAPHSTTGGN